MAQEIYNTYVDWEPFNTYITVWLVAVCIIMAALLFVIRYYVMNEKKRIGLYGVWGFGFIVFAIIPVLYSMQAIPEKYDEMNAMLSDYLEPHEVSLTDATIKMDLLSGGVECYTGIRDTSYCEKGTIVSPNGERYDVLIPIVLKGKINESANYDVKFIQEEELQQLLDKDFNIITSITESE